VNSLTVSVIIPAYRAAHTIHRADNILTQTLPASESLILDDGSPDDLFAAVAGYGDQVTLIRKPTVAPPAEPGIEGPG
jgi:glycosyltransferase involved in cell wall biosynthesis